MAETVPGFEAISWNGIVVRSGTPAPIVEKVRADFSSAVRENVRRIRQRRGLTQEQFADIQQPAPGFSRWRYSRRM